MSLHNMPTNKKQKMYDAIWTAAQTVKQRTGAPFCNCDFCRRYMPSEMCKVYHATSKNTVFGRYIGVHKIVYTDHIFVCVNCRAIPTYNWFSCNCKKTEKISYIDERENKCLQIPLIQ